MDDGGGLVLAVAVICHLLERVEKLAVDDFVGRGESVGENVGVAIPIGVGAVIGS